MRHVSILICFISVLCICSFCLIPHKMTKPDTKMQKFIAIANSMFIYKRTPFRIPSHIGCQVTTQHIIDLNQSLIWVEKTGVHLVENVDCQYLVNTQLHKYISMIQAIHKVQNMVSINFKWSVIPSRQSPTPMGQRPEKGLPMEIYIIQTQCVIFLYLQRKE